VFHHCHLVHANSLPFKENNGNASPKLGPLQRSFVQTTCCFGECCFQNGKRQQIFPYEMMTLLSFFFFYRWTLGKQMTKTDLLLMPGCGVCADWEGTLLLAC